jgi:hypothetical protein
LETSNLTTTLLLALAVGLLVTRRFDVVRSVGPGLVVLGHVATSRRRRAPGLRSTNRYSVKEP